MTDGPGDKLTNPVPEADRPGSAGELHEDAATRGWVVPPGGSRVDALFLVSTERLGIGKSESHEAPIWFDLEKVIKLDAIGEPEGGLLQVEMVMDDETIISAGWPEVFCGKVVEALSATKSGAKPAEAAGSPSLPVSDDATFSVNPVVRRRSRSRRSAAAEAAGGGQPTPAPAEPASAEPDIADSATAESATAASATVEPGVTAAPGAETGAESSAGSPAESPSPASSAAEPQSAESAAAHPAGPADSAPARAAAPGRQAALELEDVTYLGGYPGQPRRRKRCVATLTTSGLNLSGPSDLAIHVDWDAVRMIETQNSDEARFRTDTKIHRDSSALVIDFQDGSTVVLEARDCPTVPLRAAIGQLLGDVSVEVV